MFKRSYAVSFASAAVAAALVLGVPAAAVAAPGGRGPQADRPAAAAKGGQQADKRLVAEQRKVAVAVSVKDAGLVRAVRTVTRSSLAVGEAEVLANIEADRTALAGLRAATAAATTVTETRAVGAEVKAVRPEAYNLVTSALRRAAHYEGLTVANTDAVAELSALADTAALDGYDVTDVRALLDLAAIANDEVLSSVWAAQDAAVTVTAFSPRAAQRAFLADLAAAGDLLDSVGGQLDEAATALAELGYDDQATEDDVAV